jgi:hypothetical protein
MQNVTLEHNDITDGYHAGISICQEGCPSAPGSQGTANVRSLFNRIWNIMQGITSDTGTLRYNIGDANRTALGTVIEGNVVHDTNDSSVVDHRVHGSGYGGAGIYLDNQTGGATVADNVVYRVSAAAYYESEGPGPGQPPNVLENNIFAYARLGMFEEDTPWPNGCCITWDGGCPAGGPPTRDVVTNNVFYFDHGDDAGFFPMQGCAYSCGLPFDQFQTFQGNLYWQVDGSFGNYPQQFHVDPRSYDGGFDGASCEDSPGDPLRTWDFMQLPQWQSTLTVDGGSFQMDEDPGAAIVDPGFTNPVYPADDYSLASSPVAGFDAGSTNQTLLVAGRQNPTFTPPPVPETFPTYAYPVTAF